MKCLMKTALGIAVLVVPVSFFVSCTSNLPAGLSYWEQVEPYTFDVSPAEKDVVFTGKGMGGRDVFVFDIVTRKVRSLTRTKRFEREVRFLNRDTLVVSAVENPALVSSTAWLYLVDLKSTSIHNLTRAPNVRDINILPLVGSEVLFQRALINIKKRPWPFGTDVYGLIAGSYIINVRTKAIRYAGGPSPYAYRAIFNNRHKVVLEYLAGRSYLELVTLDQALGGPQARVRGKRHLADDTRGAVLSPDNRFLYYIEDDSPNSRYNIIRVDLSSLQKVKLRTMQRPIGDIRATDRWLFFLEGSGKDVTLWRMDTQGKRLEKLLSPAQFANPLGQ